jgi:hypothetical protein
MIQYAIRSFIEVMGLLNAIVRCFNDNNERIERNKLAQPSAAAHSIAAVAMSTMEAKIA